MKAVICSAFGEPETLLVQDVPTPFPGPGQVRVAVRIASLNFFDILMVQGQYQRKPPFPFVVGTDAAGDVVAVGDGVTDVKVGDRVMAFNWSGGAFAEEMVVAKENIFHLPQTVDYPAAAALKSVYGTALYTLRDRARLRAGETLLVLGAAGGLGLALVEVGKLLGARVIAAVGSEKKLQVVQKKNVDHAIDYSQDSMREKVRQLTDGKGADVIADPVGGDVFDEAVRAIAWDGRLCVLGFASGRIPHVPANLVLLKSFDVVGVNYGGWVDKQPDQHRLETCQLVAWCGEGKIRPHISATLPLDDVGRAMRMLQDRSASGKVMLTPQ